MPLSGVTTYIPTLDAFVAHWTLVNQTPSKSMSLRGGVTLANLDTLRQQLVMALNDTVGKENVRLVAVGDRDIKCAELRDRFQKFRGIVARVPLAKFHKQALPKTPSTSATADMLIPVLESMIQLWSVINRNNPPVPKFRAPLVLSRGWTVEAMGRDLVAYRQACVAAANADSNVAYSREMRANAMNALIKMLKTYEMGVRKHLAEGHELLATIPAALPDPNNLPEAPVLEGEWDEAQQCVHLSWTHSAPAGLKRYGLRYHPGPRYKMEEEELVESIPPERTTVDVGYGLAAPGSNATYKLYAVTLDGGENGSNTIRILRP